MFLYVLCVALCGWPAFGKPEPKIQVPRPIARDTWITDSDSPPFDQSGSVSYKVSIDIGGAPTSCEITKSSGWNDLDILTCQLIMKRAKFTPATIDDHPAESSYFDIVRWKNRIGVPFVVSKRVSVIEFDVDGNGKIKNCTVSGETINDEKKFCNYYDKIAVTSGNVQIRNAHVRQETRVDVTSIEN